MDFSIPAGQLQRQRSAVQANLHAGDTVFATDLMANVEILQWIEIDAEIVAADNKRR
jgi:hypothetical protein